MSDSIIIGLDRSYTAMKTAYISYSIRKTQPKPITTSAGLWRAMALSTGSPPSMFLWTS